MPLKRNEGTAGWFQTIWFKKKSTVEDNCLPFVKDDRVCD